MQIQKSSRKYEDMEMSDRRLVTSPFWAYHWNAQSHKSCKSKDAIISCMHAHDKAHRTPSAVVFVPAAIQASNRMSFAADRRPPLCWQEPHHVHACIPECCMNGNYHSSAATALKLSATRILFQDEKLNSSQVKQPDQFLRTSQVKPQTWWGGHYLTTK